MVSQSSSSCCLSLLFAVACDVDACDVDCLRVCLCACRCHENAGDGVGDDYDDHDSAVDEGEHYAGYRLCRKMLI